MMNILIPMAGAGKRFVDSGYTLPKPLVEIFNKPMIQVVVENLNLDGHYIFVVRDEHYIKYNLQSLLNNIAPGCDIVTVKSLTDGAACTALLADKFINNNEPLIIANSDQLLYWHSGAFLYEMTDKNADAGIVTITETDKKYSFVEIGNSGEVVRVAEKDPISNIATAGIYYYKHGCEFVKYARQMIDKNIRTNNEFYIVPVFNEYIQDKRDIQIFHISKMDCLGTPEDLESFIKESNNVERK